MVTITPTSWDSKKLEPKLPKAWPYSARLYQIIHEWTTNGKFWYQTQCSLRFELPTELWVFYEWQDAMPHAVTIPFVSVNFSEDSVLTKILSKLWIDTSWPFELEDAIWRTCQISVSHYKSWNWKTYLNAKHSDIAHLMEWIEVPEQMNESRFFWIEAFYETEWADKLNEEWKPVPRRDKNDNVITNKDGDQVNESYKKNVTATNVSFVNEDILREWELAKLKGTVERAANTEKEMEEVEEDWDMPFNKEL